MAKKTPAPKSRSQSKPKKTASKKVPAKKNVKKKIATGKKSSKSPPKAAKKTPACKASARNPAKKPVKKAVKKTAAKKISREVTSKPATKKKTLSKKDSAKPVKQKVKTADTLVSQSKPVKNISPPSATKSRPRKPATGTAAETKTGSGTIRRSLSMAARAKAARASAFTLDDVREIAKRNEKQPNPKSDNAIATEMKSAKPKPDLDAIKQENRVLGAASLADILGYIPGSKTPKEDEEKKVPKKHLRYFRQLVELREHVNSELSLHTEDTLKRSSKEDSGDLSSYSQHIADAGTDTFDRDFALSLVSTEQEALHEIDEAINRIKTGTFGICELTGKPISKERLLAVPFARYSVESQAQVEKTTRRNVQRGGIFADATAEDGDQFIQDNSDD